jgi:hypothetical protein
MIASCPAPGAGVHSWIMRAAWSCRFNRKTATEAEDTILQGMTRPPNPRNEVLEAVGKVYDTTLEPRASGFTPRFKASKRWPEPNAAQIQAAADSGHGLVDLWEHSPVRYEDCEPHTADILPRLFPGDPWICAGTKSNFFADRLSGFIAAAEDIEQIVPSPMTGKYGRRKKDGALSQHTLDNTGPRRFLVVEGDKVDGEPIPKDTQAAVLLHLAALAPLVLVVDSGGKSLHGWFRAAGHPEEQLAGFFRRACTLGADKKLWERQQFARMPGGLRDNGTRQQILFFNPAALP